MDREKEIEEMIRDYYPEEVANSESIRYAIQHGGYANIVRLFDLCYRKIPEGAVVLTKEEYDRFEEIKKDTLCKKEEYIKGLIELGKEKQDIRNETAREILDEVSKHYGGSWLVALYKKYGVEVEE